MSPSPAIESFLDQVAGRLRRRIAGTAFLYAAAGAGLVAVALPLIASNWSPHTARASRGWLLALALLLLAATALFAVRAIRRFRTRRQVARFVGSCVRDVESDLLSAVEFARLDGNGPPIESASEPLAHRHLVQTADRIGAIDSRSLIPHRSFARAGKLCALAVALQLAALLFFPGLIRAGWANVLSPTALRELVPGSLVSDLELTIEFPAYAGRPPAVLPASTGDFRAMPGSRVTMRVLAENRADKVWLLFGDQRIALAKTAGWFATAIEIARAGEYHFATENGDGDQREETMRRRIDVEPDLAPAVDLQAPADELDVAEMKRIELAFAAEDDHGLGELSLVYDEEGREKRLPLPPAVGKKTEGKYIWDLAPLGLRPGARVAYYVEAHDNDTVSGPNIGRSRTYHLTVYSPTGRREELLARQQAWFEKMVALLAERLVLPAADAGAYPGLAQKGEELATELGTLLAALRGGEAVSKPLLAVLDAMRGRLDRGVRAERPLAAALVSHLGDLSEVPAPSALLGKVAKENGKQVAELEQDVILLADWLDRQRLETLLSMNDDIAAQRERIEKLLADYAKSGDPKALEAVRQELERLEQMMREMAEKRRGVTEDVLDDFVNREAMEGKESEDCLGEVRRLLDSGDAEGAAAKMKECSAALEKMQAGLEDSLSGMREQRFSQEQKKLQGVLSKLADVAREQQQIAESMRGEDSSQLEQAGLRQGASLERARAVESELGEEGPGMPEGAGSAKEKLGRAIQEMANAKESIGKKDAASARKSAENAAQQLRDIGKQMQKEARGGNPWDGGKVGQEPIKIPNRDEHRAPREFREELLEAMKKDEPPRGFTDLVKRYYEELIK